MAALFIFIDQMPFLAPSFDTVDPIFALMIIEGI